MRLRLAIAAPILALAFAATAQTQYSNRLLEPESEKLLNEKAAIAYGAALEAYDRVSPDDTARQLANAAAMQPEFVDLQFRALEHCIERGEVLYGAQATEFWDLGDTIVKRLQVNPLLRQEERERARRADELINGRAPSGDRPAMKSSRDAVVERDEARFKTGLALMQIVQEQRLSARGMTKIQLMGPARLPVAGIKPEKVNDTLDPHATLFNEIVAPVPGATQNAAPPPGTVGRGGGAVPNPDPNSGANPFGAPDPNAGASPFPPPAAAPQATPVPGFE